jgi:hypothetical protein
METLSFAVVGLMAGAALLWRLPQAACPECEHCRIERRKAELRQADELHRKMHAWYGREHCPVCRPNP